MGLNKCYLPKIETLQDQFTKVGLEAFTKRYKRYEIFIGDSESLKFLKEKQKEYELQLQSLSLVDKGEKKETT